MSFMKDSGKATENKEKKPAKEPTIEVINGNKSVAEETLLAQHKYRNYRIKGINLSEVGPYYVFSCTIDNIGEANLEAETIVLTFLDSNKDELTTLNLDIPALAAGASSPVEAITSNSKIFKSFDFKISEQKKKK